MNSLLLTTLLLAQPAQEPRFVLHSTSEKLIPGTIETIDAAGAVTMEGQPAVAAVDFVALRRFDVPVPPWPRDPHLLLTNGDRIVGKPVGIEGAFLLLQCREDQTLRFPLTSCSVLWLRAPGTIQRERLQPILATERADDQVLLQNGDMLSGVMSGIDVAKGELSIDANGTKRSVAFGKVAAVAFSTRLARVRKPNAQYWHVILSNGTRLTTTSVIVEKQQLLAQTMYKDTLCIPLSDVAAIDVYQGKAVYLSDLRPVDYSYRSYQGERYELAADRSLDRNELQLPSGLGNTTFDKGLAVHGECTLTYSLDGKYQRFECQVGLDPVQGKCGSVILKVLVDGLEVKVNDGKAVTLSSGTIPLRIDVSKAKELKLIVEWGDGGYVGDRVNWCNARLIP